MLRPLAPALPLPHFREEAFLQKGARGVGSLRASVPCRIWQARRRCDRVESPRLGYNGIYSLVDEIADGDLSVTDETSLVSEQIRRRLVRFSK